MKKILFIVILLLMYSNINAEFINQAKAVANKDSLIIELKFYNNNYSLSGETYLLPISDWIIYSRLLTDRFLSAGTDSYFFVNTINICDLSTQNCSFGEIDGEFVKDWKYMPSFIEIRGVDTTVIKISLPISEYEEVIRNIETKIELSSAYTDYSVLPILSQVLKNKNYDIKDFIIPSSFDETTLKSEYLIKINKINLVEGEYYPKKKKISNEISNYLKIAFRKRMRVSIPIELEKTNDK